MPDFPAAPAAMLVAIGLLGGLAPAALATHLDYLETATARTLPGQGTLGEYKLEFELGGSPASHEFALLYGLTDELMLLGAVGLGGTTTGVLPLRGYEVGLTYGVPVDLFGVRPAAQIEYHGDHVAGKAVLSFDHAAPSLFGAAPDALNLAANLDAERDLVSATTELGYSLAASYPILGPPGESHVHEDGAVHRHAHRHALLKAGLEARGGFDPGASHYLIPELHVSPHSAVKIGAGAGFAVAGRSDPVYVKTSLQIGF